MRPSTAIDLVNRFATVTRRITAIKGEIGEALEQCKGLAGFRRETEYVAELDAHLPTERADADQDTHLKKWLTMVETMGSQPDDVRLVPYPVGEAERATCPHCYRAIQLIRERKELRRQLGAVKAAMTRHGAPPAQPPGGTTA